METWWYELEKKLGRFVVEASPVGPGPTEEDGTTSRRLQSANKTTTMLETASSSAKMSPAGAATVTTRLD